MTGAVIAEKEESRDEVLVDPTADELDNLSVDELVGPMDDKLVDQKFECVGATP